MFGVRRPHRVRWPRAGRPPLRAIVSKLSLLLVSLLIAGIVAEVFSRVYLQGTLSREYLEQEVSRTWLGDFTQPSDNPELRYELKPGVDVNWQGVRVIIANDGSRRIASIGSDADAATAMRVAILGDSSSFG